MKIHPLHQLLIAACALGVVASSPAQSVISYDFRRNSDEILGASQVAGAVGSVNWNQNAAQTSGSASALLDGKAVVTTAGITWASSGTWASGPALTTDGQTNMHKGYLDDGGGGATINFSNIPYASYSVLLYVQSDQGGGARDVNTTYRAYNIGGTFYRGGAQTTVAGIASDTWTGEGVYGPVTEEGRNYLRVDGFTGTTLSIAGQARSGSNRGSITAVQIVDTSNFLYWDSNGNTAGAGGATPSGTWDGSLSQWNAQFQGTSVPAVWIPGRIAAFSAGSDATGSSTVTVSGTQVAGGLWFEDGTVTLTGGAITLGSAAGSNIFVDSGSAAVVSSNLSGSNGLVANGPGSLTLSGTNTYTGTTLVANGRTTVATAAALPVGSAVSVETGATLELAVDTNVNYTQAFTGYGTLVKSGAGNVGVGSAGNNQLPNLVEVNGGTLTINAGGFSSDVMTGNGVLTINTGGTAVINRAHALGGNNATVGGDSIRVNGGTLTLGFEQYVSTLQMTGGTVNGTNEIRAWSYNSSALQVNASANTATFSARTNASLGSFTYNVADGAAGPDLMYSGTISGSAAILKTGAGTMVMSGTHSNSGALSVNAGALLINGSKTGTGTVAVASGATLGGTGSVAGATTFLGGSTLNPGDNPVTALFGIGSLDFTSNLALNGGSNTQIELGAALGNIPSLSPGDFPLGLDPTTEHDSLEITGTLTANGIITLSLTGGHTPFPGDFYDIFDTSAGPLLGSYSLTLPALAPGFGWNTSLFASEGILFVVPEPGRAVLFLVFGVGSLLRRRRE